jgi:aldose 1-epimerase
LKPMEALAGGPGKGGQRYFQQHGFCLEPQGYPNAPNLPNFPSAAYLPGQIRQGRTLYRFLTSS